MTICRYLLYLQSQVNYLDLVVLTVEYSFSVLSLHTLLATLQEKHKHTKHNFHVSRQIESLSVVTLLFSRLDSIQAGGGAAAVGPGQNILSEMSQH